jgi:hypothetical protein
METAMNETVAKQNKFRVWGFIDGKAFDAVFETVAEWKREKTLILPHATLDVRGMVSIGAGA